MASVRIGFQEVQGPGAADPDADGLEAGGALCPVKVRNSMQQHAIACNSVHHMTTSKDVQSIAVSSLD